MSRRRITALDVLGEVRRAMRILRRVERYMVQQERAAKRAGEKRQQKAEREARVRERFHAVDQP